MTQIQLRNGKQLPLPPWMVFHHLPEYGIAASSSSGSPNVVSSSSALTLNGGDDDDAAARKTKEADGSKSTRNSSRRSRKRAHRGENISPAPNNKANNKNSHHTSRVSASDRKIEKEAAMDSLDPPTSQEIDGHIRYLSEVAIRIVAKDVDDCVRYCLRYSSTPAGKNATEGAVESVSACATKMMKRNDNLMTLVAEIQNFFDKFQPHGEDTDDDTIAASLKTKEGMEAKETDASATHLKDILSDMLPKKYDPTLLPMITIKCYPNVLDRAEMTKGLLSDLSKKNRRNPNPRTHQHNSDHQQESSVDERHPCICVIRSTSELVQQGNIMTEVLSQCISNDPNGEAFAKKLQWQRKRQKSGGVSTGYLLRSMWSWTRSLVDWAGFTEAFDSIIVILEVSTSCIFHFCSKIMFTTHHVANAKRIRKRSRLQP